MNVKLPEKQKKINIGACGINRSEVRRGTSANASENGQNIMEFASMASVSGRSGAWRLLLLPRKSGSHLSLVDLSVYPRQVYGVTKFWQVGGN